MSTSPSKQDKRFKSILTDFDSTIYSKIHGDFWATWQDEESVMKWIAKREDAAIQAERDRLRELVGLKKAAYIKLRDGFEEHSKNWNAYELIVMELDELISLLTDKDPNQ